jgi:hypothetical protein
LVSPAALLRSFVALEKKIYPLTMADPTADVVDSNKPEEKAPPLDGPVENDIETARKSSSAHKGTRRVTEWEALQIAQAGDLEIINAEVEEIEAELHLLNLRSTWYKPLLTFRDPKMFNYLLVGKLRMMLTHTVTHKLTRCSFCLYGRSPLWY